jgi:hypothetical protein
MSEYANITTAPTLTAGHRETRMTGDPALLSQLAGDGIPAIARPREAVSPRAPHMHWFGRRPLNPAIERLAIEQDGAGIASQPRCAIGIGGRIGESFKLDQVSSQCGR